VTAQGAAGIGKTTPKQSSISAVLRGSAAPLVLPYRIVKVDPLKAAGMLRFLGLKKALFGEFVRVP
jgi:hypothetical protein